MNTNETYGTPIGYNALIEIFHIDVLPHFRTSYIAKSGRGKTVINSYEEIHIYPRTYAIKNFADPLQHIEFALKHDGINLSILRQIFSYIDEQDLIKYIENQPTGKYAKIIWYLFELLTEKKLNLPDSRTGNYVELLDNSKYYTSNPIKKPRYRVNDNLLGNNFFCPIIRKTNTLKKYEQNEFDKKAHHLLAQYDPLVIIRAGNYLYTKETKSSYEIEHEHPQQERLIKFIAILKEAVKMKNLTKADLIKLQNIIVDPRYQDVDYRHTQNYVGENIDYYRQKIHYIAPKPENVNALMDGLLLSLERMISSNVHPVIIATAISFGFVFIHPFEDGNGRLHRFLIHCILSAQGFTPKDFIFPISAVMLKNLKQYDQVLELFSVPLLKLITEYSLNNEGIMQVMQDTKLFYQFIDYSAQTEYLFSCIEETIATDFKNELRFVENFDKAKNDIQNIVDMPDKKINLIIKLVIQNKGKLAEHKRKNHFPELNTPEVDAIVNTINKYFL